MQRATQIRTVRGELRKGLLAQMWTALGVPLASFSLKLGGGASVDILSNPKELDLLSLPLPHLLVSQSGTRGQGDSAVPTGGRLLRQSRWRRREGGSVGGFQHGRWGGEGVQRSHLDLVTAAALPWGTRAREGPGLWARSEEDEGGWLIWGPRSPQVHCKAQILSREKGKENYVAV